ncbi:hypothetical protein [Saccharomonospora sp. NB11]|uniref:hypothetical protein n=1 Tax=Saccharomonospora sp. NB11 TaxID=1642298 RepID=UPI0018D0C632|nr:hypothetical protein [Saccharomonospora sp. NB11]
MRSVRRGLVATAIAFPLAFGFAGVAAAGENTEGSVDWAEYEASIAVAGPEGAFAGEVSAEAFHADFAKEVTKDKKKHEDKKKDQKHGDKRSDDKGDKGCDKKKHESVSGEVDYAAYEDEGAAASYQGAIAWDVEAESFHAEKN